MKILELSIRPKSSYEPDSPLVGKVVIQTPLGEQTINLSHKNLSDIFTMIREEVVERAQKSAKMVGTAMDETIFVERLQDLSTANLIEG